MDIQELITKMDPTQIMPLCYFIVYAFKQIPKLNNKWLPLISMLTGAIIGAVYTYGLNCLQIDIREMPLLKIELVGMIYGLATTGFDQVFRQIFKK